MQILPDFSVPLTYWTTITFLTLGGIQLFWLFFFYLRFLLHKDKTVKSDFAPISVIMVARNEEDYLVELLPTILEQDYPEFEVIVVNNQSEDYTDATLKALQVQYPDLRIIELERNKHLQNGKKLSLTIAIKGAKYEHLLITEANCKPDSKQWIKQMAGQYSDKTETILGYVYTPKTNGFLNRLIRIDFTINGLNYLALAKGKCLYMGKGENLGFTKSRFLENGGYKTHYSIINAENDLFLQEITKKKGYTIATHPNSFCQVEDEKDWKEWRKRKAIEYASKRKYPLFKKVLLGIYPISYLFLLISFVILLLNNGASWITIGFLALVLTIKWIIMGIAFKKLNQKSLVWGLLFWEILYILIQSFLFKKINHQNR